MINKKDGKEIEETDETLSKPPEEMPVQEASELDRCRENVQDLENQVRRVLADYRNLEKRVQEEKSEWIKIANKQILLRLLSVLDTLILANKHIENQGLTISIQQFLDILKDEGVTRIDAKGKTFDPHTMECVETIEGQAGKVIEEIRIGFMIYDKILRPVHVTVGKGE